MVVAVLFTLMIYVTMVYGPIPAYLVELFPTKIRYMSMSLPCHPAKKSIHRGALGGIYHIMQV